MIWTCDWDLPVCVMSWISGLNVLLSLFVSSVFVRCGGLPQPSQRRVFPGPGLSRALSVWRNGGGLLEPQTHQNTPSPTRAHHWPVRDQSFSKTFVFYNPTSLILSVSLCPRGLILLSCPLITGSCPRLSCGEWISEASPRPLTTQLRFPWEELVRVTMRLSLCSCVEDTSGFSLCSPINSSHRSHSLCLSLSVFLRLSDYSLHPLAQLLIYRALAGMLATRNQHFMSDVLSHGRPR